jgi:hypothetical protein
MDFEQQIIPYYSAISAKGGKKVNKKHSRKHSRKLDKRRHNKYKKNSRGTTKKYR